jgi:DnaK suppressor protein
MTRVEIKATKRHLTALLHRLNRERADLSEQAFGPDSEEGGGWDVPRRPDEQGGVRLEDEVTLGLLENEGRLVAQINAALDRLNAGTYGYCESCSRPISVRRLRSIPYASHCIDCARMAEQEVGG